MPVTTLTIGSDSYSPTQRADAGIAINRLELHYEQPDELSFIIYGCGPNPNYKSGPEVTLSYGSTLVFKGNLSSVDPVPGPMGWIYTCRARSLMHRSDWVTITGQDGTGQAVYNRPPIDALFVPSDAGLTIGTIISRLLRVQENADRLSALGIGAYTSLSPPTLPASTVADLALMDVVPTQMVIFQGHGILNHIQQEMSIWCPRYAMRLQADGTLRFRDLFNLTRYVATMPTEYVAGDDIEGAISESTENCFTAWKYIGVNIQPAMLSVRDGTLKQNWTGPGAGSAQNTWKYSQFTQSNDRAMMGSVVSLTSTSATVDPDSPTATYGSNTLSALQAQIYLVNTTATGILLQEFRYITSNTALSAGGTFTVTWDASVPLDATGYDKFHILAMAGGLNDVWRSYLVREPGPNLTGLSTYIGSHMVPRFRRPIAFANNGKIESLTTAAGKVLWSSSGNPPYNEYPLAVEIDNAIGGVRFNEPVVKATATGGIPFLTTTGSPTTNAEGLPYDVQVIVPYNRGGLEARVPSTGNQGTAYTQHGITRTMEVHIDSWDWIGDRADIIKLATEHLLTTQDVIYTGSVGWYGLPSAFSAWDLGMALDVVYPGPSATELKRYDNLPVRDITISWENPGIDFHVTCQVSNFRRPFQGDSLYLHPAFGGASPLDMQGAGFDAWNSLVADRMSQGPIVPDRMVADVGFQAIRDAAQGAMLPDPTDGLPTGPPSRGGIGNANKANPIDRGSAIGEHALALGPDAKARPKDTLVDPAGRPDGQKKMPASGVGAHPAQFNPRSNPFGQSRGPSLVQAAADLSRENERGIRGARQMAPVAPGAVFPDTRDTLFADLNSRQAGKAADPTASMRIDAALTMPEDDETP